MSKKKTAKIESKLKHYHHRFELIRTIMPFIMVTMQAMILFHLFNNHPQTECGAPQLKQSVTESVKGID